MSAAGALTLAIAIFTYTPSGFGLNNTTLTAI
jgi:hypothetical protein